VFDIRLSGIFALVAFILSLLIGLVSGSTMPMLIIRPLIFAVIFFVLSALIKVLVGQFLPELLEASADEDDLSPGSRVNILEDDDLSYSPSAVTDGFVSGAIGGSSSGAKPDDSEDNLGDISELSAGRSFFSPPSGENNQAGESISGIDQNAKERYTDSGGANDSVVPDFSKMFSAGSSFEAPSGGQARAASTGAGARTEAAYNSDEALPDLDSMAEAFMSDSSNEEQAASEYSAPSSSRRPASSNKAPKWTEDFNPKEIAMGLRTALSKDKEG